MVSGVVHPSGLATGGVDAGETATRETGGIKAPGSWVAKPMAVGDLLATWGFS